VRKEQYEGQLDATDWAWGAGEAKLNATTNMSIEPAKNATLPKLVAKPKPKPLTKEEVQIKAMAEEAKMDGSSPAYLSEHDAAAEVNAYQKKLHKAAVTDKDVQTTDKRNDRVARSMTSWKSAGQRTHANADDEGLDMDDWAWNARHSNSSALPGSDKKKEHDASVDVKAYQAKLHLDTQKDKAVTTFSNATEVKVKTLTKWKNSSIRNEGYDVEEQKDDWAWSGNNSQKSNLRGQ
jgi:hypothetical protein